MLTLLLDFQTIDKSLITKCSNKTFRISDSLIKSDENSARIMIKSDINSIIIQGDLLLEDWKALFNYGLTDYFNLSIHAKYTVHWP